MFRLSYLLIYFMFFLAHLSWGNECPCHLLSTLETDDCYISFIECQGDKFVLKQIKDTTPDEQFLLVIDTLGCCIADSMNISMNKVKIISHEASFVGKKLLGYPATLHTFVSGVSTEKDCLYSDIRIHQRFRKPNSVLSKRWGTLLPEKMGLTLQVIQDMSKHADLPKIAALDTFVGNADRSAPNLYYDEKTDRFCGIDMAASFSSPLALTANQRLGELRSVLSESDLLGLIEYANVLESLIEMWPPERQESYLLEYSEAAGFIKGNVLFDQNVMERIEFHKRNIKENYNNCLNLQKLLKDNFKELGCYNRI